MTNDVFAQLAEDYGLDVILEQNDIEPWQVLQLLWNRGLLDIEDYWYREINIEDED